MNLTRNHKAPRTSPFACRSLCALALTLSLAGACSPLTYEPIPAPHDVSLKQALTPNAAFLFRRPRTGASVGSSGSDGDWAEFQVGLLRGGLNLKDAELLEQLLRDNPSADYEAIRARTQADYLIEILTGDIQLKYRPNSTGENVACEIATVTIKVVDIRTGSHVGLVEHGLSGCPEPCEISRSGGTDHGETTGSCYWTRANSGGYDAIYPVLPSDSNRWRMLGGEIANILQSS